MIERGFSRLQCSVSGCHFRCKQSALSPSLPATWSNFGSEKWSNCAFAFYFFTCWGVLAVVNFVGIKHYSAHTLSIAILLFDQSCFAFLWFKEEVKGPSCLARRPQRPGLRWCQKTVISLCQSHRKIRFLLAPCSNDEATLRHLMTESKSTRHLSQFPHRTR